jgi:hypothetical protein
MKRKRKSSPLPKKIRITHKVAYEVVYVDGFSDPAVMGECRYESKQIVLNTKQPPTELRKTLIHEVFHAISFETPPLNLTETQVLALEKAVDRVLRLNKLYER